MSCLSSRIRITETLSDMPLDERHQANFDHPDSIDSDMLVNHLMRLKQGLSVEMPLYDFVTHTRSDEIETDRAEAGRHRRRNSDICRAASS